MTSVTGKSGMGGGGGEGVLRHNILLFDMLL